MLNVAIQYTGTLEGNKYSNKITCIFALEWLNNARFLSRGIFGCRVTTYFYLQILIKLVNYKVRC